MENSRAGAEIESLYPNRTAAPGDAPSLTATVASAVDHSKAELMEMFWRGRWIILAAIVVAVAVSVVVILKSTPLYESHSQIYVSQTTPKIINDGMSQNGPQEAYYLQTQCEVIKSVSIISLAVEKGGIKDLKTFEAADNAIGAIKGGLAVDVGKMNDLITVSYESPSPEDSAVVVNAVVEAYKSYNDAQSRSTAAEVLRILEKEYNQRTGEMNDKMKKMVDFRQQNGDVDLDGESKVTGVDNQQLSALTAALVNAQMGEADARASLELARSSVSNPQKLRDLLLAERNLRDGGSSIIDVQTFNPLEAQLSAQLTELETQREDLGTRFLPSHPDIKFLDAKIARVKEQLGAISNSGAAQPFHLTEEQKHFADSYLAAAEERLRVAQLRVKSIDDSYQKSLKVEKDRAANGNNKAATYQLLKDDFLRAQKLCDDLDARMKDIHVSEDAGNMNVTILEVGRPALVPSKPQKGRIVGVAILIGLTIGLGLAFLNGWMDQRFRSAEDVSNSLHLPILGAVPQMQGREPMTSRGQKAHLQPISDFAEACRAIRTAIYFGMPDSQAKTLLVTSPLPGDGKSTAASNLAIVMAQAGQKTLILDADFRRPNQHRIFGLDSKIGASSVLAGKVSLEEAIKPSGINRVDVLPCGPTPNHPAELLNSQSFADLLQELSRRYDHVVIDSPPIMPVTDARILGAICDATVFVVRAEKSTRKVSVFARDVLQSVGTNILGVMINGLSRGRGYYDAGYYQYGYGGQKHRTTAESTATREPQAADASAVAAHPTGSGDPSASM